MANIYDGILAPWVLKLIGRAGEILAPAAVDQGDGTGALLVKVVAAAPPTSTVGTPSNVAANAASVQLLAANAARKDATITNDGTANLFVSPTSPASAASYAFKLGPGQLLALPIDYTGALFGIWDVANGNARITEWT